MIANLCLYWRFNEVQAGKVLDSSGLGNSGTLELGGNVSAQPLSPQSPISDENEWGEKIPAGHALRGPVCIESISGLSEPQTFTLEACIRRVSSVKTDVSRILLSYCDSVKLLLNVQGFLAVESKGSLYEVNKKLPLNQWMHVALVCDKSAVSVLVDGSSVFSNIETSEMVSPGSLRLGSLVCELTEVRLWSIARSAESIREYMESPLPSSVSESRWKGLRIKPGAAAAQSSAGNSRTGFFAAYEGSTKSRRVEQETVSPNAEKSVDDNHAAPQPLSPPLLPAMGESPQDHLVVKYEFDQIEPAKTPPELADLRPEILPSIPSELGLAISFFDAALEAAILKPYKIIKKVEIAKVIRIISTFIKTNYRIGPFLVPMPPESILLRLRTACSYFALATLVASPSDTGSWRSLLHLRVPLLPRHVAEICFVCIQEAVERKDSRTVILLQKKLIDCLASFLSESELARVEKGSATLTSIPPDTLILCPFCRSKFQDPLQEACVKGCRSKFAVCFLRGKAVPVDVCITCKVCTSVMSNKRKPILCKAERNIPTSHVMELPESCPLCSVFGSLYPLS